MYSHLIQLHNSFHIARLNALKFRYRIVSNYIIFSDSYNNILTSRLKIRDKHDPESFSFSEYNSSFARI